MAIVVKEPRVMLRTSYIYMCERSITVVYYCSLLLCPSSYQVLPHKICAKTIFAVLLCHYLANYPLQQEPLLLCLLFFGILQL